MFSYEIKKELACELVEYIENEGIQDMYLCDISNNLYNNDYYIIGIYQARKWLKKYFDDMLDTIEYWEDETGEPYTHMITDVEKLANFEKLATLVAYTVVDTLLYEAYNHIGLDSDKNCDASDEKLIYQYLLNEYK